MHFQGANGGDHHGAGRLQAGGATFDVEEFFAAQIGAEAGLGNHDVGQFQAEAGGHDRVAAVCDVGERAAMDQRGGAFQGLHKIRGDGVLQQDGHRAVGFQVGGGDVLAVAGLADDHLAQPRLQFGQVLRQAENRHDLGGDGDVEAVLAGEAVGDAAEAAGDAAQRAVIHVEAAAPGDAAGVDTERVPPVDGIVDHRGEQVVGRGDGVEVAGEVQVDLIHRHDLGVAAAGRATLHAEAGAEAGLAQADRGAPSDAVQRIAEADGGCSFALARRRWVDAGDQHQGTVSA